MRLKAIVVSIALFTAVGAVALGHTERPSYFPDPAPDNGVRPSAGGQVPKARSLASALKKKPPGRTRVVCQRGSMRRLRGSIRSARANGYEIRPTDRRSFSAKQAKRLKRINQRLKTLCKYREIQPAVTASGNNDRVVIMPGFYVEPTSRAKPTNDPDCSQYEVNGDRPNETGALSFAYQFHCPNDQNLIAVIGRRPGSGQDPSPPRFDPPRHPQPWSVHPLQPADRGLRREPRRCRDRRRRPRPRATEGLRAWARGRTSRFAPTAPTGSSSATCTVRHAKEHGIYVLETDGYLLDRFKAFYNGLYGTLTFVADHGVQQNCEAVGHGDSGIYPGAGAETGAAAAGGAPRRSVTTRRSGSATCTTTWPATPGPTATRSTSTTTRSTTTRSVSRPTSSPARGTPATRATRRCSRTTTSTRTTSTRTTRAATSSPSFPFPVGTGAVDRRRQQPHGAEQPHLGQLAPRDDAVRGARLAHLRPGGRRQRAGRLRVGRASPPRTTTATTAT